MPTATHIAEPAQLTPLSRLSAVPDALGLVCNVNAPPVECSTTVVIRPDVVVGREIPTAKQLVMVGHDTPSRMVSVDDARFALL